ncbi:FAD-binding oxidoreductase [Streptacidiphilus sp. PB12-B1b]|uniref:styrene monooxygenase/indole monooxygenase family protein n=1 Tax=Streptacidiphilus sp. PB12-B1b TaxID=2705012 RepID=UPI0015FC91EE|nr:styrene monooxygenase/indole monooxygenase family protein [Streptacidiphilus sp. PB12-B1b]QMU77631.1 FAD-binding oxidoreductase [Streptacidiphilus sp. PB12-B1b]
MAKILIVGAGQAGLQLALGLQGDGHDVTVMTDRTPDEIRGGRVLSTQCMFDTSLGHERALGLNLWDGQAPRVEGLGVSVSGPDAARVIDWVGRLDGPAQSVDQRVKMPAWLELFAERGGKVVVNGVTVSDLDLLVRGYDLTLVAAGKGELVSMFARNPERSPYTAPQRALAVSYVHGLGPRPEHDFAAVRCNLVPGVGELFVIPALTLSGPCDILFWEGVPGGPLDVFEPALAPEEHLRRTLELMRTYTPWEYQRTLGGVELTDGRATLAGRYTPVVRHAVGELPSGGTVLGVADVVVANDPITGQGSNSASKCATSYLSAIRAHGDRPFDRAFMEAAFEGYWTSTAGDVTAWTNAMLAPPPEHVLNLIGAAGQLPPVAARFANGFDNPSDFPNWFFTPEAADAYLGSLAQG